MIKKLSKEAQEKKAINEAWKKLSRDFSWTESMLEKYQDIVDWHEISLNWYMAWTIPMVHKFKDRIDWSALCMHPSENLMTETFLDTFKDELDWSELSFSFSKKLTDELLVKFADKWDWGEIIDYGGCELFREKGIDFYERYKDYIPLKKLYQSRLWDEIIAQKKAQLIEEITG